MCLRALDTNSLCAKVVRRNGEKMEQKMIAFGKFVKSKALKKEAGVDGILVTVGLCIIALLLCVVMKDSLTAFIQTIVTAMTEQAKGILTGVA